MSRRPTSATWNLAAMARRATAVSAWPLACLLALAAPSSFAQGRFTVAAGGQEVRDSATRLVWRRCAEGMRWDGRACNGKPTLLSLVEARQKASAAATPSGAWRVPTREELVGLVDASAKKKPRIDAQAFPQTPAVPFWAARAGSNDNLNAWLVNFRNGHVTGNVGQRKFALRLVRDGA